MKTSNAARLPTLGPLLTLLVGLVLLAYMVIVEDEPGAIPLALVVGGMLWFFVPRFRARSRDQ
jgi:hypothetical protein